jgi:hypothetical protein
MSAVLVTGATGLLGHHTARALNQQGCGAARLRTVGQRPNERHWPCRPDSCDRGAPSFHHGPARSGAAPANTLSGWLAARGCGRRSASDPGTAAGTARSGRSGRRYLPVGPYPDRRRVRSGRCAGWLGPRGCRKPTPLVVATLRLLDRLRGTGLSRSLQGTDRRLRIRVVAWGECWDAVGHAE